MTPQLLNDVVALLSSTDPRANHMADTVLGRYLPPNKYQIVTSDDGSILAVNPADPYDIITMRQGTKRKYMSGGGGTIIDMTDPDQPRLAYGGTYGGSKEPSETLDADAERYRQTGTLPPNMGRGIQGQQLAAAIRTRAVELEQAEGGDPATWPQKWTQFKAQKGYTGEVDGIAAAIKSGDQPPVLTGLYGLSGPIRQKLEKDGFNLTQAQIEWTRAQKQIQALNNTQMTRFVGLASSVTNTIDEANLLAAQMKLSGIPMVNRARLATYMQTEGNSPNGQLAARYIGAINTVKEEFANLANGGYAPTDAAWTLANQQIDGNYGVNQLDASLQEVKRLINYRVQSIPGLSQLGAGADNRYTGAGGAPAPSAKPSSDDGWGKLQVQ